MGTNISIAKKLWRILNKNTFLSFNYIFCFVATSSIVTWSKVMAKLFKKLKSFYPDYKMHSCGEKEENTSNHTALINSSFSLHKNIVKTWSKLSWFDTARMPGSHEIYSFTPLCSWRRRRKINRGFLIWHKEWERDHSLSTITGKTGST